MSLNVKVKSVKGQKGPPNGGYGQGPVYLSGQYFWYSGGGQAVFVLTDPSYTGPVLVRVKRLDGTGTVTISGPGQTLAGSAFGIPESSSPPDWGVWFGSLTPSVPGCYGFQFDGATFSDVAVIKVSKGPPSPELS